MLYGKGSAITCEKQRLWLLQVEYHRLITILLHTMHFEGEKGTGPASDYWMLKVDAQRHDLRIYADESRVKQANQALLSGDILLGQLH